MKSKINTAFSVVGSSRKHQNKYSRMGKKVSVFIILLVLASCGTKRSTSVLDASLNSGCPKDGDCTVAIFDNKSMTVKTTELGSLYYELAENTSKKVIKYTYNRKVKGNIQDASYREEIVFEINSNADQLVFTDESLQDTQLLFGRFCYCKGQTGYYKIDSGSLRISKNSASKITEVDLSFKSKKVPQVTEAISILLK